jgi:RsmE family RNA methyltransferase
VSSIIFVGTDLGDPKYLKTTLLEDGGAREALLEGMTQARDTLFPCIQKYTNIDVFLTASLLRQKTQTLICADNIDAHGTFLSYSIKLKEQTEPLSSITIAIGSERGWSARERALFAEAGFCRLSLGVRALRTETACVAACAFACELSRGPAF